VEEEPRYGLIEGRRDTCLANWSTFPLSGMPLRPRAHMIEIVEIEMDFRVKEEMRM